MRRGIGFAAAPAVVLIAASACTGSSEHVAGGSSSDITTGTTTTGATIATSAACPVSPVHTTAVPSKVPGFSAKGRAGRPWMRGGGLIAVLFYSRDGSPTMNAGGVMAGGGSTKILWYIDGADGAPLVIHGTAKNGGAKFSQTVAGIGGGQYPSIPNVPSAGCWTLTESVNGKVAGSITVPVQPAIATAAPSSSASRLAS